MKTVIRTVRVLGWAVGALALIANIGCGTSATESAPSGSAKPAGSAARADGLSEFQVEHGIGPVTAPVTVGASIDQALAKSGQKVFDEKCASCHKMGERYVGPALGDVTQRRSPAFVMNMVLNPQEMYEKHPATKKLFAEYLLGMPNQHLTPDEARQVLEYLRSQKP